MKNIKATFEALQTIAQATEQNQEIKFYLNEKEFTFSVAYYKSDSKGYIITAVEKWGQSMVVEKITNKALHVFDFSMFGKKIEERVSLEDITLAK